MILLVLIGISNGAVAEAKKKSLASDRIVRAPKVQMKSKNKEKVTIMVYMNGSNLEGDDEGRKLGSGQCHCSDYGYEEVV